MGAQERVLIVNTGWNLGQLLGRDSRGNVARRVFPSSLGRLKIESAQESWGLEVQRQTRDVYNSADAVEKCRLSPSVR